MQRWEYLVRTLAPKDYVDTYERRYKEYLLTFENSPTVVGLQSILDYFGKNGWELIVMHHYPDGDIRTVWKKPLG